MADFNTNGCIHNPAFVEEVVSQMANPFFASAAPSAAGSGKNKLILLHENFKKLKVAIPPPLQTSVGDCFNPSSLVNMADGSKKRLDEVVVGDMVVTPFGTIKLVKSAFKKPYTGHMLEISTKFSNVPLVCTPDHKIWHDNNWTRAELLSKQSRILSPNSGGYSEIESIQKVKPETNFVYCIEVEDDHAFICDGYAVHNCVSHACATALDYLCVTEIANGEREQWVSRIASEFIYSNGRVIIGKGRLGGGDGSLNAWTLKAMKELGTLVRQKYGRVDLSEYNPSRARTWGNTKVPQTLLDISKDFFITGYKLISNFEEAMDALASGCPIVVASNQGFTKKRDKDGFCSPSGSWSHSMAIIGGDSQGRRPGMLIQNCFSKDTEILTENGWKLFENLDHGEKVATVNLDTWTLEYQVPEQYQKFKFNGEMLHFKGRFQDCLVTPNHNMVSWSKHKKEHKKEEFELVQANKLTKSNYFIKYAKNFEGKEIETINICGYDIPMDDWLQFLGFYLAEGWATVRKREMVKPNSSVIRIKTDGYCGISQNAGSTLDYMEEIVSRLPFKFKKKLLHGSINHYQLICYNTDFANYLSQFGKAHEKHIPKYVFNLSRNQQRLVFKCMMLGDGNYKGTKYTTNSNQLKDDFQRLCLHLGYATDCLILLESGKSSGNSVANHTIYSVSVKNSFGKAGNGSITKIGVPNLVPYNDYVYCVSVPNHTVVTRRNGITLVTGQSWPGYLSGPKTHNQPESSFWCDADVFNKMAKSYGDTFALFGYNGHKLLIDNKVWT